MFCPKCGSILRPVEKKGKKVLGCSCGHIAEKGQKFEVKEKGKKLSLWLMLNAPNANIRKLISGASKLGLVMSLRLDSLDVRNASTPGANIHDV
jgi:hypothetical protein